MKSKIHLGSKYWLFPDRVTIFLSKLGVLNRRWLNLYKSGVEFWFTNILTGLSHSLSICLSIPTFLSLMRCDCLFSLATVYSSKNLQMWTLKTFKILKLSSFPRIYHCITLWIGRFLGFLLWRSLKVRVQFFCFLCPPQINEVPSPVKSRFVLWILPVVSQRCYFKAVNSGGSKNNLGSDKAKCCPAWCEATGITNNLQSQHCR